MKSLAEQFTAIDASVSEEDFVTTLLCSLPSSFDSLIRALESREPRDLTRQFVIARLMDEAEKRQEIEKDSP